MKKIGPLLLSLLLIGPAYAASTSYQATLGSGAGFAAWCVGGSGAPCTGGVFWPGTVIANSSGAELFTSSNAGFVQGAVGAFVDGADVTLGSKADAIWTSGPGSLIALAKAIATNTGGPLPPQTSAGVVVGATSPSAAAVGGSSSYSEIVPANTTGISIKNAGGTIYDAEYSNIGTAAVFVKLYDTGSTPTCGSGTPIARFVIPANSTAALGAGSNISFGAVGRSTTSGIGMCVTGGFGDSDTTNPVVNTVYINIGYK